ncbi:cyanocobalamin reductase / alkylcobalamin dealkylase isoform X1 [Echeneis naucrates]|uniref:Cyanocobalamin reductase / alkylcobalamin dealkylase n=1 Tax=Echeneis naucrates TaxID=173247 RepID=A0A665UQ50_ECHNA|nr:methylmalonic aciduria and homocystinuria type C protein isoform X1 [Echeneis naucrates]
MAVSTVSNVTGLLEDCLSKFGFEVYPLKIGWYNSKLDPLLHLSCPDDTLAVLVLSTPSMFEQAFLPFIEKSEGFGLSDPIDQCVKLHVTSAVSQCFSGEKVDVRYDYEMLPNRMPRFLAQTAAHVSGAAFYYQQSDVLEQPWGKKKMFGVCVHPKFGGWFAIRALLVFENVTVGSEMVKPHPIDCVPTREGRIKLLENYNFNWKDGRYRDIIPPVQTYSQRQKDYFTTPPAQRFALLKTWGFLQGEDHQPERNSQSQAGGHG